MTMLRRVSSSRPWRVGCILGLAAVARAAAVMRGCRSAGCKAPSATGLGARRARAYGYETAQALAALLQRLWTAKVPVLRTTFCACAPGPEFHAHLSPFSWPALSYHALSCGSVTASAYSWPATMLTPSRRPGLLT